MTFVGTVIYYQDGDGSGADTSSSGKAIARF